MSRTEVLGAVLGPGVSSTCWDLVRAGPGVPFRVGSTDVQTASISEVPRTATELQLGEEEAWSGAAGD